MPKNWAYEQILETTMNGIDVDKCVVSPRRTGLIWEPKIDYAPVNEDLVAKYEKDLPDVYDAKNHCFYEGTNQLVVYNTLKNAGLNLYAIAGIMGNIQKESLFDPESLDPLTGAYGLFQWQADRKDNLKNYASQNHLDYTSCKTQISFFFEECNSNSIVCDNQAITALNNLYNNSIVYSTLLAADCIIAYYERCTHHTSWEEVENAHYKYSWDTSNRYDAATPNQFNSYYYIDVSKRRGYSEVYYKYLLDM